MKCGNELSLPTRIIGHVDPLDLPVAMNHNRAARWNSVR
jgi:hypothetical protein